MHHQASHIHASSLLVVVDIDDGLLPLASWYMTSEQNVDLTERPFLHLWDEQPRQNGADQGGSSPDVATLAAEVPLLSVEHVAGKEDARDVDQVVGTTSDTSRQWPKTDG